MPLASLRRHLDRDQLQRLVERVAQRSEAAVWQRVAPRVAWMPRHEAIGYIRARGAIVWERELAIAQAESPELMRHHRHRAGLAIRQLVTARLLAQASRERIPHRERRAA